MSVVLFQGTAWLSRAIRWQTRGAYNHAAVLFADGTLYEARFREGVIKRTWGYNPVEDEGWAVMAPGPGDHEKARDYLEHQVGKKYDWLQALRFVTRRGESVSSLNKWFCSELAAVALIKAGTPAYPAGRVNAWEIHPHALYQTPALTLRSTSKRLRCIRKTNHYGRKDRKLRLRRLPVTAVAESGIPALQGGELQQSITGLSVDREPAWTYN